LALISLLNDNISWGAHCSAEVQNHLEAIIFDEIEKILIENVCDIKIKRLTKLFF